MHLLLSACSQKTFDDKEEMMAYISNPKNGYTIQKSVNGVDFSVAYRPTDLLVLQEVGDTANKNTWDSLKRKYEDYLYLNVSISKNDKELLSNISTSRTDFGAMVSQLAFGMGEKVHLYNEQKDTIGLLDYVYPRVYGMGGATNMLFVYPRNKKVMESNYVQFTIEDIGLSTGEVGFQIPIKKIIDEPKLNLK
ncbi:hypothetical protein [Costertonia aggregata]|uniref:Uncharacterized protein n=1 Tax=Costertonia aggregata TaxID=343403 RepID=A0A7H9ATP5_9FLAO|nr:hypothetical protein [Costertonia aggregata]QLG46777.1 hypothetical protein HYG79_15935 [Costertonia aggregata]